MPETPITELLREARGGSGVAEERSLDPTGFARARLPDGGLRLDILRAGRRSEDFPA
jgi:hypothetical protein